MGVTIRENPNNRLRHFTITVGTHIISTTVTSHPGVVRDWLYYILHLNRPIRHRLIVGLGVQWTSSYSYTSNPAATLQLCVGDRCLIFHLYRATSSPRILRRILSDPTITFVGLYNHSDATKLAESNHRLYMAYGMPFDLRRHVVDRRGRMLTRATIEEIAEEVVGVEAEWSEEVSRSDWEVRELSVKQIQQAAVDAFLGYFIGMKVHAWEFNPALYRHDYMDTSDDY